MGIDLQKITLRELSLSPRKYVLAAAKGEPFVIIGKGKLPTLLISGREYCWLQMQIIKTAAENTMLRKAAFPPKKRR